MLHLRTFSWTRPCGSTPIYSFQFHFHHVTCLVSKLEESIYLHFSKTYPYCGVLQGENAVHPLQHAAALAIEGCVKFKGRERGGRQHGTTLPVGSLRAVRQFPPPCAVCIISVALLDFLSHVWNSPISKLLAAWRTSFSILSLSLFPCSAASCKTTPREVFGVVNDANRMCWMHRAKRKKEEE